MFNLFKRTTSLTPEEQRELDKRSNCFKCKYLTEIRWFYFECKKFKIDLTSVPDMVICDYFEWDKSKKREVLKEFEQQELCKKINFRNKEEFL